MDKHWEGERVGGTQGNPGSPHRVEAPGDGLPSLMGTCGRRQSFPFPTPRLFWALKAKSSIVLRSLRATSILEQCQGVLSGTGGKCLSLKGCLEIPCSNPGTSR